MSRRYLILSIVCVAGVFAVAVSVLHRRPTVHVAYAAVTQGPITREVLITGTLEPKKAVDAGSQVSGTLQSLDADFNSRVHAGQVIARLDPSIFDAQIVEAQAEVTQADAEALKVSVVEADARTKLERAEVLAQDNLIPATELETARLTAKQAAADLRARQAAARAARADLKQAQVNRDHTVIRSPIDGIVVNRSVEVGQTLAARVESPVLFTIADLRQMNLLASIDQAEVGEIKPGTRVTFHVESLGPQTFDATVAELRLAPNVEAAATPSGTATASASTTNPTGATAARGSSSPPSSSTAAARGSSSSPPASTAASSSAGTAQSSSTAVGTSGLTTSSGPGVVTYTAVIAVPNPDSVLAPGTTATITLPVGTRSNAIRVPNNALTFRPSPQVFEALGQKPPQLEVEKDRDSVEGRLGYVWAFDDGRFRAIKVRTGLADEGWTEVLSGEVTVGERLVTRAGVQ